MAKYTELFSEYLEEGYDLPNAFSLIEGFSDLFKMHYCDKEIGFETEALFALKLEERARIFVPLFAERIQQKATAILGFDAPVKTFYDQTYATLTNGAQEGSTTELPFDADTATPSVKNHTDEYENSENRSYTRQESGRTTDEVIKALDYLNGRVTALLDDLLEVFKPLFMGIY